MFTPGALPGALRFGGCARSAAADCTPRRLALHRFSGQALQCAPQAKEVPLFMIEYGMPTLMEYRDIEGCARLCSELGLNFVEINMNLPQYQPSRLSLDKLEQLSEQYGIYYTLHLDENLNVADFNRRVAAAYCATVADAIRMARRLHMPVINMHMAKGVYFTMPERKVYLFDEYNSLYMTALSEFRDECTRLIGQDDIALCVENTDGFADFQLRALDMLLDSPAFALTLDTGHDYAAGGVDLPAILARSDRLRHMHVHDAAEQRSHLALGAGKLDLDDKLKLARKFNCRAVIETKTAAALRQSVRWLAEQGRIAPRSASRGDSAASAGGAAISI